MLFSEVLSQHQRFCRDKCASYSKKPAPGWCGQAFMHKMNERQEQGKCPWPDEEIIRHTGGKR